MKEILTPAVPETARYFCDLTGLKLKHGPVASITIRCGYGAPYDGSQFELHLSSAAADVVLPFLRAALLGGAPLQPHRTDSLIRFDDVNEPPIGRRERANLMRRLEKLCRSRKKTLASAKRKPEESGGVKKTRSRIARQKHQ